MEKIPRQSYIPRHSENVNGEDGGLIETEKEGINSVNTPSFMASLINTPIEASVLASTTRPMSIFGCFSSKRVCEDPYENNQDSCVDRRYKRMMKNRESAARSRARRQAYTNELEREIAELVEENSKLRKQHVEKMLAEPVGIPKKKSHNRSMTAPF